MRSLGGAFRSALHQRFMLSTADERIALTARLAEEDLEVFCAAKQLPRDEGRLLLQARRSAGRRRSCANETLP